MICQGRLFRFWPVGYALLEILIVLSQIFDWNFLLACANPGFGIRECLGHVLICFYYYIQSSSATVYFFVYSIPLVNHGFARREGKYSARIRGWGWGVDKWGLSKTGKTWALTQARALHFLWFYSILRHFKPSRTKIPNISTLRAISEFSWKKVYCLALFKGSTSASVSSCLFQYTKNKLSLSQ